MGFSPKVIRLLEIAIVFIGFKQMLAAFVLVLSCINVATAQNGDCQNCGEDVECKKVCCLKCYEREVVFTCYKSEFEDFCVPCPSKKCGERCVAGCLCTEGADGCGIKKVFGIWQPCGAEVKMRRRLMRKIMIRKVPDFRWEVQTRCASCCQSCMQVHPTLAMPAGVPALPAGADLVDLSELHSVLKQGSKQEVAVADGTPTAGEETAITEIVPVAIVKPDTKSHTGVGNASELAHTTSSTSKSQSTELNQQANAAEPQVQRLTTNQRPHVRMARKPDANSKVFPAIQPTFCR